MKKCSLESVRQISRQKPTKASVVRQPKKVCCLNGTHQLLAYADGVNLQGDNIDTIKKRTQTVIDASEEGGLEMNRETRYVLLSRHQNASQNQDISQQSVWPQSANELYRPSDSNKSKSDLGGN
jgi:hypothetical protein